MRYGAARFGAATSMVPHGDEIGANHVHKRGVVGEVKLVRRIDRGGPAHEPPPTRCRPRLLSIELAYSLEMVRSRKMEHDITCRDLEGFFEHVWSVHPAVGASREHSRHSAFGLPSTVRLADHHTVMEGRVGQFERLDVLPRLNFVIAQMVLFVYLMRLVRSEGISIIRVGDPYYTGLLGLALARLNRAPLVVRINANYDFMYQSTGELAFPRLFPSRRLERRVAGFVLARADLVAAGSDDNLGFAIDNGARPERSTIFRYGTWVDPIHFESEPSERPSVRAELGVGARPMLVLVSRLERVKHPDDVVHVLAEAKRRHSDLAAVFVGDGSMRDELESLAAELGLSADVFFAGNRDQRWVAAALSSADVVLSPLTGRALVEACLSGTPVVAYDVEWHSELVSSGETGVLVPYRDMARMADAVCSLLCDPERARVLGEQGRTAALRLMDPRRLMEHERSEYRKLLERRR